MEKNENIELITGNPKKAINKLAPPIILSMFLIFANNIIDSIWVSGLGSQPLASLGYITPLFLILVAIGNGIGAGGNSLISRYIGAQDHNAANNAAIHNLILSIIISIIVTIVLIIAIKPLLYFMGASSVMKYATDYGFIIFLCSFTFLMPPIIGGGFRAEGDINRATIPISLSAILNMILDPIFIYVLHLGLSGAAISTALSCFVCLLLMFYWIYIKNDTYLSYNLKDFHPDLKIYKDILVVGIPASIEQIILAILNILVNVMLTLLSGPVAVAVFTVGWRIISVGFLPAIGYGTATISVAGVAYGAKKYENLTVIARYAVKISFIVSIIVCILINIFSYQIADIFAYTQATSNLKPAIADFLKLMCLFILFVPFGATACNIFQGVGKGNFSLILTIIREFALVLIFSYLLGFIFKMGIFGLYSGMLLGGCIGTFIAYIAVEYYIKLLIKKKNHEDS